jgi:hypothetical protein
MVAVVVEMVVARLQQGQQLLNLQEEAHQMLL